MKALLIDSKARTITAVEQNNLKDIYRLLHCDMVEAPVNFANGDTMYCDEEAWLKVSGEKDEDLNGFMIPGWSYSILGNALIVGTGEEGEDLPCKSDPADFNNIIWRNQAYMYAQGEMMGLI